MRTAYERHAPAAALVERSLATSVPRVFWIEDAPGASYEPLAGDITADLVVVGAGYCGLWTALLAKREEPSLDVVVVEAGSVGWAASGRNGGFCEASLTHGEGNGRSRWPGEYDDLVRLGRENLDGLERDVAGLDVDFARVGELDVATEEHQLAWLDELDGERLDTAAVRAEIDSPLFLGGVWDREDCALVHPAKLARELARAATEAGVRIHEQTRALALEGTTVRTDRGVVRAERVALATNAFPSLLRRTRLLTIPVYDYVLMTEPLTTEQRAAIGWRHGQGFGDLANQFHYSRPTADGRILYGGYDAVYHPGRRVRSGYEDRPETYRRLASHFLATFPQLEDVRFSHRWAGAIDTCTQFVAFHGLARDGRVAYAAGFTGLGVGATRFAAQVMLDRLAGRDTERTRLTMVRRHPLPFPPEPLTSLGVTVMRRGLDRADHREGRRGPVIHALDALGLGFDS
ncbi:FAD-dependent oxidoreductase [Nocardioides mangrovicus]|uniref:FAD-dependent oxidoreductase n=1 Tax=Nocardioides mangrovicus TaxID=2478913 RepID=A0A3L8P1K0_9ACTN|nr:FAD-dependent oxidoreductase [Nocardioides mangrovicus]RLV48479.1 FAD-dependent oxidoreductase [Nocardioides mangrovicus]